MFTKLVVPLDGSLLAEKALPFAIHLANRLQAHIMLLRVVDRLPPASNTPDYRLEVINKTELYLKTVQETITNQKLEVHMEPDHVHTRVVYGNPAHSICDVARAEQAYLVVMTTHGRNDISRLILGSIAANVIQDSCTPVTLIRPMEMRKNQPLTEILTESVSLQAEENTCRIPWSGKVSAHRT